MNQPMKILFAYDGSECAHAALGDLRRAGLPPDTQVTVISVAEFWLPTPHSIGGVDTQFSESSPTAFEQAEAQALEASQYLRTAFPHWEVSHAAVSGSPARILLEKADAWRPDLIVIGSHGRTALGRFFLGSVSQKVLTEADCSVRIARGRATQAQRPVAILIGMDGSPGAVAAVQAVAARQWPPGSEARLLSAEFSVPAVSANHMIGSVTQWLRDERERIRLASAEAETKLRAAELTVTTVAEVGDPKQLLIAQAEQWEADCIFVGAKKRSRVDRFLLGSVSAAVAARAQCSVEVVRV